MTKKQNDDDGYVRGLSELLVIGEAKEKRRIKAWRWDDETATRHRELSRHWTREEAEEQTPTKPGRYVLLRKVDGHRNLWDTVKHITVE